MKLKELNVQITGIKYKCIILENKIVDLRKGFQIKGKIVILSKK